MIVRRIGAFSLAKVTGAIYGALGLVFGLLFGLFILVAMSIEAATGGREVMFAETVGGLVGGIVLAVVMPIMYLVIGFVGGLLTAWLYNVFAARFGGVELEMVE